MTKIDRMKRFFANAKNMFDRIFKWLRLFFYKIGMVWQQKLIHFYWRIVELGGRVLEQLFQNPRRLYDLALSLTLQFFILVLVREILSLAYITSQELVFYFRSSSIYTYLNHSDLFIVLIFLYIFIYIGMVLLVSQQKLIHFYWGIVEIGERVLEQLFENPQGLYRLCISLTQQLAILLLVREILRLAYTIDQALVYFLLNSPIYTYLNHFDVFFDVFIVLILLCLFYLLIRFLNNDDDG